MAGMASHLCASRGVMYLPPAPNATATVPAGMDNVRNMTGSPIAGIDPHEFLDVRALNYGA